MSRQLQTDAQFERALRSRASVYAKDKLGSNLDFVGALDAFNPIYVTVSGSRLFRGDFEFVTIHSR
ncbi:hypothetical protein [Paenibacillus sp.]|uniref:hypothetical protein n=1 Tax=Paenibacillus sp. TaxID=58172 RepID=UPI0028128811|nr:hypothetical protein [Paenibacillus sp.]